MKNKITATLKQYGFLILFGVFMLVSYFLPFAAGIAIGKNFLMFFLEMAAILPLMFILTPLFTPTFPCGSSLGFLSQEFLSGGDIQLVLESGMDLSPYLVPGGQGAALEISGLKVWVNGREAQGYRLYLGDPDHRQWLYLAGNWAVGDAIRVELTTQKERYCSAALAVANRAVFFTPESGYVLQPTATRTPRVSPTPTLTETPDFEGNNWQDPDPTETDKPDPTETDKPDPTGIPQCSDGKDNDNDGKVDMNDRGCDGKTDDDESDDPPYECVDGIDNDSDGKVDGADRGCGGATDDDESDDEEEWDDDDTFNPFRY